MASDIPTLTPRQELLLTYLALGDEELDPVRIVKGLFIFCQEAPPDWFDRRQRYDFEPYNWGPFSFDLYRDLERLVALGLVTARTPRGATWRLFRPNERGRTVANVARQRLDKRAVRYLQGVRGFTLGRSFHQLLKAVYKRYPEYAVNSAFRF